MPALDGEVISSAKEIYSILKRLSERATPITIQSEGSSSLLTTYIESIQLDKQQILLDAPLPEYRQSLLDRRTLTLTTRYNGCLLTLSDMVMTPIQGDEEKRYRLPLPKSLHLLQRRQAYRAPVRTLLRIDAKLFQQDQLILTGHLKDLSTGGCCIVLKEDCSSLFTDFSKHYLLTFIFPNATEFTLMTQVVRADYSESTQHTYVGCFFVELTHPQEQFINKVVGDLQRDFISHARGHSADIPELFISGQISSESEAPVVLDKELTTKSGIVADVNLAIVNRSAREDTAPVDIKKAYISAVTVIKSLINHFRADKSLPIEQAKEASTHLQRAFTQDRQALIILSRQRDLETYLIQHSISYAISFAEVIASRFPEHANEALIEKVMLGGLLHNIAQASLPDGLQHYELLVTDQERALHIDQLNRMTQQLEALKTLPLETLNIVRDFHERLDGSGIPKQKTQDQLNPVSKMASVIYAHERLSYVWHQQIWYFHPLRAFKQLIEQPEQYHITSIRALFKQYGKYPLGATIELSDQTLALVMRHNEEGDPSYVRVVYDLSFDSLVPPRDLLLADHSSLSVVRAVNPIKYSIDSQLLKLALKY